MAKKNDNTPAIRFNGFDDSWEQRKLGEDIVSIQTGTNLLGSESNKGTPLLKMGNIQRGYFDTSKLEFLDENETVENENIVYLGDFFFNTRNTMELVGKGATWRGESGKYAFNSNIARFKFKDIDTIFFNYLYNTEDMTNQIHSRATGTTSVAAIYPKALETITYFVPLKNEQTKIGAFFAHIDTLITLHQRKCDTLQKFKKSMLQKMFPQNGESVPKIRFAGFTDNWEQRKFSELTEIRSASRVHKEEWQSSGVPFYRSSDVMAALNGTENEKAFISEELYKKLSAVSGKLEKGDVLVTGGGSVGKPYIVPNNEPLYTKDADLLWIKNNENLDPYFVYTFFFSPTFTDYLNSVSHVGTIAHYTITQLGETPIALPCVSEQQKIGAYFSHLDNLITLHQRKLEKLKNIKKSMLEKMFVQ